MIVCGELYRYIPFLKYVMELKVSLYIHVKIVVTERASPP